MILSGARFANMIIFDLGSYVAVAKANFHTIKLIISGFDILLV